MKITKEQVKEAYDNVEKLKEWYPEAFDITLEVGVWYKSTTDELNIVFIKSKSGLSLECYGFDLDGDWMRLDTRSQYGEYTKATKQEIETTLIAEAKKRGYKKGNYECLVRNTYKHCDKYIYCIKENKLFSGWNETNSRNVVFKDGIWAEIIKPKQMTKDEIEKELGYKIEIV